MANNKLKDVFGFIKPHVDVHTMGLYTMANLLRDCGYKVFIANDDVCEALENIHKLNNYGLIKKWIVDNNITRIAFSYRMDPKDGRDFFMNFYERLSSDKMFIFQGGIIKDISFAGLADTCELIARETGGRVTTFKGKETPIESLGKYNIPKCLYPKSLMMKDEYEQMRLVFTQNLLSSEKWKLEPCQDHFGYETCGLSNDTIEARLDYAKEKNALPIIRTHSGPYNPNRIEALKEYNSWCKDLASSHLLDVLSIGTSQLTQSNFGEDWQGLSNGGGVPINSELEYQIIKENAAPMLVRTYAGTKDVPALARIHEKTLNIAWHALSFWWFNELDGRGSNTLLENLKEHFDTIKYIVSTNKPVEPNVPHHFAFRGADDITYIISGYLAAKACKIMGIKHLILQIMLNTPRNTTGFQDLAKARVLLKLIRGLEDNTFKVSLQTRAGLDYFEPNLEKAMVQLGAVTCMMDDIEPNSCNSPEIIHVVNYSEAVRLATPPIIVDSIKITLATLHEYRKAKAAGIIPFMDYEKIISERQDSIYSEAYESIKLLEHHLPNLYSPEGFYNIFCEGFLPVPYLMNQNNKYKKATMWKTALKNGGIYVVDDNGNVINTIDRYKFIIDRM